MLNDKFSPYTSLHNGERGEYLSFGTVGLVCLATYLKQVFQEEINVHILDLYDLGGTFQDMPLH